MENKQQLLHRLAALLVMLLLCAGLAGSRLVDLQLVHGQEYLEPLRAVSDDDLDGLRRARRDP